MTEPAAGPVDDDDLAPLDTAGRVPRLRDRLVDEGCDAIVVSDLTNIRYLTGFTGSNATLVVTADTLTFVTDGRYRDQSAEQLAGAAIDADVTIANDPGDALRRCARGITRIGLEADTVAWATQRRLAHDVFSWAHLVPTEGVVAGLRAVKDPGEIDRLGRAAEIADAALADVRDRLHDGLTEAAFRRELEDAMADHGADAPSFETIVASGPNGAKPHARPGSRVIGSSGEGELVVIDFGATFDGYHSDMTRTIVVGEATETQRRMLDVVRRSQSAGVAAVRAGVRGVEVDRACRDVITDAGWGDAFIHGTGHGIGLVIHEEPRLSTSSDGVLAPGHCVTVEPGVYLADHGGVRIEDSVVVTADGCRLLTSSPYD